VRDKHLPVFTRHRVNQITPGQTPGSPFLVRGSDPWGVTFEDRARFVVLATGGYNQPRPLDVPGEELPKVSHYFTEVHPYAGLKVVVVGGGNSAVEAALQLFRAGSEVTLVHRRKSFRGLKYWIQPDLENRIKAGEIKAYLEARLREIRPHDVLVETASGQLVRMENDHVLALTGYQPDVSFLQSMGVKVDPVTLRPAHNPETLETNVPGLFVAGVMTAGNVSNEVFIENSRHHGEMILRRMRKEHHPNQA
jgi:thioredoxin reductase (NADPH)